MRFHGLVVGLLACAACGDDAQPMADDERDPAADAAVQGDAASDDAASDDAATTGASFEQLSDDAMSLIAQSGLFGEDIPDGAIFSVFFRCLPLAGCADPSLELACVSSRIRGLQQTPTFLRTLQTSTRALREGRIILQEDAASDCLALLPQCADFTSQEYADAVSQAQQTEFCEAAFVGTAELGEPCEVSGECKSDYCDRCDNPFECCPGRCEEKPEELRSKRLQRGDECRAASGSVDPTRRCEEGTFCTFNTRMCASTRLEGDECELEVTVAEQCVSGTRCTNESAGPRCRPALVENEPCPRFGEECGPGLYCLAMVGGGVCKKQRERGEACSFSAMCLNSDRCDPDTGTCRGPATEGESCEAIPCERHLSCSEDTKRCVVDLGGVVGEECGIRNPCSTDLYCDGAAQSEACETRKGDGAECRSHLQCTSLYCDVDTRVCGPAPVCDPS